MTPLTAAERVRAFGYVVIAAIYYYFAQIITVHATNGLVSGVLAPLAERAILLFLLVVGYAVMGRLFSRQSNPVRSMGLDFRTGWRGEFALGTAMGWGMLIVAILPLVLTGGLIVNFWAIPRQFGLLLVDLVMLAVAALAEEVAFRGYPFQRLVDAMGPGMATILASLVFAGLHIFNPAADRVSFWVTMLAGWLLSVAYLRTRALWVCWGWHFSWNASMCLLFGLPISGITQFSPVVQSNTIGPKWMTGGIYGPEASTWTALVLFAGIFVVHRALRKYAYLYTQPVIVPAGIPVDLDAMSSVLAPHHAAAPLPAPAGSTLVQITPLAQSLQASSHNTDAVSASDPVPPPVLPRDAAAPEERPE